MPELTGPTWGPASGGVPRELVIICHGVGASGEGLIHIAQHLGAGLPDAVFLAPNGMDICDMAPPDAVGSWQWFSLQDRRPAAINAGVRRAAEALDGFIDAMLAKYQLPPTAYALAGFSQGAMLALFAGLRRAAAPRAILAYSGALIDIPTLATEMKNHAPVLLVHGEADATVPVYASRQAEAALRAAGVPLVTQYTPGLAHSIDEAGLEAGVAFLRQAFG